MLFNEPKLLKPAQRAEARTARRGFSALQRAEIAENRGSAPVLRAHHVSVLFNEPKLLKSHPFAVYARWVDVSVLFNEPKLLKYHRRRRWSLPHPRFSALQRAEIAEIVPILYHTPRRLSSFSALQRAEIAES